MTLSNILWGIARIVLFILWGVLCFSLGKQKGSETLSFKLKEMSELYLKSVKDITISYRNILMENAAVMDKIIANAKIKSTKSKNKETA